MRYDNFLGFLNKLRGQELQEELVEHDLVTHEPFPAPLLPTDDTEVSEEVSLEPGLRLLQYPLNPVSRVALKLHDCCWETLG